MERAAGTGGYKERGKSEQIRAWKNGERTIDGTLVLGDEGDSQFGLDEESKMSLA